MKASEIFATVEQDIAAGKLKPGDKLPTVREAAEIWGVNKNTVVSAYKLLQEASLIYSAGRNGSIVGGPRLSHSNQLSSQEVVALDNGNPDRAFLPGPALLKSHLQRLPAYTRMYGEGSDNLRLLEWAEESFTKDDVPSRDLLVGGGAMEIVSLAIRSTLKPGDLIALEDPVYATTLGLVRSCGLNPISLELDSQGVVPESLTKAIRLGCKTVLISSRSQNPTGVCTSQKRAARLKSAIAEAPDVLFIDDDHSGMLEIAPYRNFISKSALRWMVIRSVSKFLGPDLRVAVASGDTRTIASVSKAQSYTMGWVSSLLQGLAGSLLHDPSVRSLAAQAGRAYRDRFEYLKSALTLVGVDSPGTAGLNIWVPWSNDSEVVQSLMSNGWRIRPGSAFVISSSPGFRISTATLFGERADAFVKALTIALGTTREKRMA